MGGRSAGAILLFAAGFPNAVPELKNEAFQSEKNMNALKRTVADRNGSELSRSLPADGSDPIGRSSAEPFATQHLLSDLKRHTISGGVITMSAQGAKFAMNLVATVVLARLLTPRDFGLIAMVTGFTAFLTVFRHAGLATPTIQRDHITQAQVTNLFWVNLGVSGLCTVIVAALAPVLAWFYHDSRLISITLCLSTTFLIGGFRVQHLALLR